MFNFPSMFIILETAIMKKAIEFLIKKNYFLDIQEAKEKLKELWFDTYDRDGTSNHVLGSRYIHTYLGYDSNAWVVTYITF